MSIVPPSFLRSALIVARSGRLPSHNALAESGIGLSKTEVIRRLGPWRNIEAVAFATLDWVDLFNTRRLLNPIGNMPPAEAEARFHAVLKETALATQDSSETASGKAGAVHP